MQIHLAPVLMGTGTRLFEHLNAHSLRLHQLRVLDSARAAHIRYRLTPGTG